MKILLVSRSDTYGGAAVAARRLLESLLSQGQEVRMLVLHKSSDNPFIQEVSISKRESLKYRLSFLLERLEIFLSNGGRKKDLFSYSTADFGGNIAWHPWVDWADVVHLHWINQGFLSLSSIASLAKKKPLCWTLHDFWPLYGIRHLPSSDRLGFGLSLLQKRVSRKKRKLNESSFIHYIAVSQWQKKSLEGSLELASNPIEVIGNPLDVDFFFHPISDKEKCPFSDSFSYRLLFVAARLDAPVKGLHFLEEITQLFAQSYPSLAEKTCLYLIGNFKKAYDLNRFGITTKHIQSISNSQLLASYYRYGDLLLSTSLYETFGQTLSEALAAGCMAISFSGSGPDDILEDGKNGALIEPFQLADYADAIATCLGKAKDSAQRNLSMESVKLFDCAEIAKKTMKVYRNIISKSFQN